MQIATGGAAPPSVVIGRMGAMGFAGDASLPADGELRAVDRVHVAARGLDDMLMEEKSAFMARQGVNTPTLEDAAVFDPATMMRVPADGMTMGELMLRGNTVMKGVSQEIRQPRMRLSPGGWFHTGDLAVMHADGYVEVKDRAKDIIISGGENISSLEVEEVLYKHPDVMEAAVVARPDAKWGETPHAFVTR